MFELNKVTRTIDGEVLKPFVVQGDIVLCSDRNGNTLKRKLSDFDFSIEEEEQIVTVQPTAKKNQDINIQVIEEENVDQLFPSEVVEENVFKPEVIEEEQKPNPEPPAPEPPAPEPPAPEPPAPDPPKPTSIWDTLDGDYL